jgi:hypothetical protein
MSESVPLYNSILPVAMPGMKVDSMNDNVESHPCGSLPIEFGVVCCKATGRTIAQGGVGDPLGISVHDHLVGSRETFTQYDAVNVLTRGRVWARCTGAGIADGARVYFNTTGGNNGLVTAVVGTNKLLPNATFRSLARTIPPIWPSTTIGGGTIAVVELHYPMSVPPAAP